MDVISLPISPQGFNHFFFFLSRIPVYCGCGDMDVCIVCILIFYAKERIVDHHDCRAENRGIVTLGGGGGFGQSLKSVRRGMWDTGDTRIFEILRFMRLDWYSFKPKQIPQNIMQTNQSDEEICQIISINLEDELYRHRQ